MKTVIKWFGLSGLLISSLLSGCEGVDDESATLMGRVRALDADLSVGASGEQVRTLNELLSVRGYYPNAALAAEYPAWRPPVGQAPDDPSVFDERTALAVGRLQAKAGLQPTGTVDAALRKLMTRNFCGVPDNLPVMDEHDKFSFWGGQQFARGHVSWRVMNFDEQDLNAVRSMEVFRQAFSFWSVSGSGITFDEKTNTQAANITISFADMGVNGPMAATNGDANTIRFNTRIPWEDRAGDNDLQSVAMHEIGHVIGFNHSAWSNSTMFTFNPLDRSWSMDDIVAASAAYDTYVPMPGSAIDVGIGANGDIWAINRTATSGGNNQVVKWSGYGNSWIVPADLSEGVRISVEADGTPWVVKANGDIFRRTSPSTSAAGWQKKSNSKATDIGVGANGNVWITDRTPVNGGFRVCKFDGTNFVPSNGGGVRVSVTDSGKPWIVAASGEVFRRDSNSPTSGTWSSLGASVIDVAVGPEHPALPGTSIPNPIAYAWSVATKSSNTINVAAFAEQPFIGFGGPGADVPYARGWVPGTSITASLSTAGPGAAIAMGPNGTPIVVSNLGTIYRSPF